MKNVAIFLMLSPLVGLTAPLPPRDEPPVVSHVLRIWGNAELKPVVDRWLEAFGAIHRETKIEVKLTGSDIAMAGLYTGSADLALLGREATGAEVKAFEWIYRAQPAHVELLTGAANAAGHSPALVFYVRADNPLASITLAQADALFGHDLRRGGSRQIRTWGELGLTGDWADRPIHLFAPNTESGTGRFFREVVLKGSRHLQWERLAEFEDSKSSGRPIHDAGQKILAALNEDRFGLAVTGGGQPTSNLKALALATDTNLNAVLATTASVGAREYALARPVAAYFNRSSRAPVDPILADFLRYALGSAGQKVVTEFDGYIPLSSQRAAEQLKQLD